MEIRTPFPSHNSKRHKIERWLDKYNHIMEFIRTIIQVMVLIMQAIILFKIS